MERMVENRLAQIRASVGVDTVHDLEADRRFARGAVDVMSAKKGHELFLDFEVMRRQAAEAVHRVFAAQRKDESDWCADRSRYR